MEEDKFSELFKIENLKLAANYFFDDARDNFVPDFFRYQDYIFNLDANLRLLAQKIKTETYRPHSLLNIDVPKNGLSVRPGSSIDIEDHIVFFAIAYLLAPILDRELPENVFHFRVRKKDGEIDKAKLFKQDEFKVNGVVLLSKENRAKLEVFEEWYEAWPDFASEAQSIYEKEGFNYLVETDITSYFENISHPLLADVLRKYAPGQIPLINFLMRILSEWTNSSFTGHQCHRGIPQGNDISSWLGTLYLIPLDKELMKLENEGHIKYIRYVDDIKVFTKDPKTARSVIFLINKLLRDLQLNMQSSKTNIYSRESIRKRLVDDRVDEVNKIIKELPEEKEDLKPREREEALTKIRRIYEQYFSGKDSLIKEDHRLFKRTLTALMRLESRIALSECIKFMISDPILTEKISRYLYLFRDDETLFKKISSMVFGEYELFSTQYLSLLPLLRKSVGLTLEHKKAVWKLATEDHHHWAVRGEAILTLGLFLLEKSDYLILEAIHENESSSHVKKVILSIFLKAKDSIKWAMWDKTIYEVDYFIDRFRKYIWGLVHFVELSLQNLKKFAERESDPGRTIPVLRAALQAKNIDILKKVSEISLDKIKNCNSSIVKSEYKKIARDASLMVDELVSKKG